MPPSPPLHRLDRLTLAALGLGGLATVLLVVPYKAFELDRFFVPKEIALHIVAVVAGVAALARSRRLSVSRADLLLLAWLALSALSAIFAGNHWLAGRALALSVSSVVVYWSARQLAAAELGDFLVRVLAAVIVAGALLSSAAAFCYIVNVWRTIDASAMRPLARGKAIPMVH